MPLSTSDLSELQRDGFLLLSAFMERDSVTDLEVYCSRLLCESDAPPAGIRNLLGNDTVITNIAASAYFLGLARRILGDAAIPVRVILFDKSPEANWGVPWHQDLNIAVAGEGTPEGYGPRTTKAGVPHIVPPTSVLENMVTLRLHLDPCTKDDGPLVVAPGSHLDGKLSDKQTDAQLLDQRAVECCAAPGDLLVMRPLLFHRSAKAASPRARKVLHIEYAGTDLASPLSWFFRSQSAG